MIRMEISPGRARCLAREVKLCRAVLAQASLVRACLAGPISPEPGPGYAQQIPAEARIMWGTPGPDHSNFLKGRGVR